MILPLISEKYSLTEYKKRFAALMILFAVCAAIPQPAGAEDVRRSVSTTQMKFQTQSLEKGQFQFSLAPCYYKSKTDEADWYSTALLFRAYVTNNLELAAGTDFPSYQRPDFGVGDVYAGAKWTFYDAHSLKLSFSVYLNFPTGSPVFRNPGIQPSLALTAIKTPALLILVFRSEPPMRPTRRENPVILMPRRPSRSITTLTTEMHSEFLLTDTLRTSDRRDCRVFPAARPIQGPSPTGIRQALHWRKACPDGGWTGR